MEEWKGKKVDLIIGNFEVIHQGHWKLFERTDSPTVLTFNNIPRKKDLPIFSFKDKCRHLYYFLNNPDSDIFIMDLKKENKKAASFVKFLKKQINPTKIIVGSDFKFGSDFKDVKYLSKYFNVDVVERDKRYSTTKIREHIANGQIEKAQKDLITLFRIDGKVVKGKQLGRKLGYKTANIYRSKKLLKVCPGVYYATTTLPMDGYKREYPSSATIRNIEDGRQLIEVHLIGQDLPEFYGKDITVHPKKYINEIKRPKSLEDLRQIIKDNFVKINKVTKN